MVGRELMSALALVITEKIRENKIPTVFVAFSNGEDVVVCAHGSLAEIVNMTTQALNNTITDSPTGETLSGERVKLNGIDLRGGGGDVRGH